jgi:deoxyadenosine/deoxycytidine kinase
MTYYEKNRVEICGVIASGKTTVARLLGNMGFYPVLEDFQNNTFLASFYFDPPAYAFETEISLLLQHYHQVKKNSQSKSPLICDFSLLLDYAFSDVTLLGKQRAVFQSVFDAVTEELHPPSVIIHLRCPPEILLQRIKRRGREVEKTITLDYLMALDQAIKRVLEQKHDQNRIISIDSDTIDLINNPNIALCLMQKISAVSK